MHSVWNLVIVNKCYLFFSLKNSNLLNIYGKHNSGWNYRVEKWGWARLTYKHGIELVLSCNLGQVIWPLFSTIK